MKRALAWVLLLGAALAGPCAERPYTLETEEGLLGGENLSYDGEVLVLEGRACLEREGLYLEAPLLRYREGEGLEGRGLTGEAEGWRLEAESLEGKALRRVRLEKGSLKAQAERVLLERPPVGQGVYLESPAYRVRAEEARFSREEARLKGFLATPCPCGEEVRLVMAEARFDPKTGELLGEASLGLWGLEIPLGEARANAKRRPALANPLVLSGSEGGGFTLGLQDFPLPRPGEEIGRWERAFTLLGTGLATSQAALRLGYREGGLRLEGQLGYAAGIRAQVEDAFFAFTPTPPDADTPRLEARYAPAFRGEGLTLSPFLRYAETGRSQGWTLGVEGSYRQALGEGPFRTLFVSRYGLENFVLQVSRVSRAKGQVRLMRALKGTGLRLVFIGPLDPGDPEGTQEFLRLAQANSDWITYLGPIDHRDPLLASAYKAAKIHVLPSASESFGLVNLEALAAGTAVVSGQYPPLYEVLGERVYYCDPFSERSIRKAVLDAYERGPKPGAVEFVRRELTWNRVGERLEAIYKELIG